MLMKPKMFSRSAAKQYLYLVRELELVKYISNLCGTLNVYLLIYIQCRVRYALSSDATESVSNLARQELKKIA